MTEAYVGERFRVNREGNGRKSILLLPGLGCGPWIYGNLSSTLSREFSVYSGSIPGFDGAAPGSSDLVSEVISALGLIVERERLSQPAIVAHSIGGAIAIAAISRWPGLFGSAVIVDAAPRMPGSGETLDQRLEANRDFAEKVFGESSFKDSNSAARKWVSQMVFSEANVDQILASWERSDRQTLKNFLVDGRMLAFNLDIDNIDCPVCVVAPFDSATDRETVAQEFADAYRRKPNFEIELVGPARHFVMLDQPERFIEIVRTFLSRVPGPGGE